MELLDKLQSEMTEQDKIAARVLWLRSNLPHTKDPENIGFLLGLLENGTGVRLTVRARRDALELLGDDAEVEEEVVIAWRDNVMVEDGAPGEMMPPGLFMWLAEYPEEGCLPVLK